MGALPKRSSRRVTTRICLILNTDQLQTFRENQAASQLVVVPIDGRSVLIEALSLSHSAKGISELASTLEWLPLEVLPGGTIII
jgi:hypothetical protein